MNQYEVSALKHGVYRVFWKSGGYSLASIGFDETGTRWVAPANWLDRSRDPKVWHKIEKVELIEAWLYDPLDPYKEPPTLRNQYVPFDRDAFLNHMRSHRCNTAMDWAQWGWRYGQYAVGVEEVEPDDT